MDSYIDGDWLNAQSNILGALIHSPHDGPMRWLQEFMDGYKNLAPEDWANMRDLDKKQKWPEWDAKNDTMLGVGGQDQDVQINTSSKVLNEAV